MKIANNTFYKLLTNTWNKPIIDDFQIIQLNLIGSDNEDGGGEYDVILKRIKDNKFFKGHYFDWDIDNTEYDEIEDKIDGRCDLNCELIEVFPKEKTIIVYE